MTVTFNDIQAMLASRPVITTPHEELCHGVLQFLERGNIQLSKEWQEVLRQLSVLAAVQWPEIQHPRVALYASSYGKDDALVHEKLQKLAQQQDPLTQLCALLNADLRVYELDLESAVTAQGLTEAEACHALSYGLMAVEEHVDGLVIGSLSNGADVVLQKWCDILQSETEKDVFSALREAGGGTDIFAMLGAVCAARMAKIPVFMAARQVALWRVVLARLLPDDMLSHCVVLPCDLAADDVVQALQAVQNLRFILALVPQLTKKTNITMPSAA